MEIVTSAFPVRIQGTAISISEVKQGSIILVKLYVDQCCQFVVSATRIEVMTIVNSKAKHNYLWLSTNTVYNGSFLTCFETTVATVYSLFTSKFLFVSGFHVGQCLR